MEISDGLKHGNKSDRLHILREICSSCSCRLLFDIVHEKKKEHKSITVQKDVKEHQITFRFSSQGAPFNLTKF